MEDRVKLEEDRQMFLIMKKKLNDVMKNLTSARGYMTDAKVELEVAYTGEEGVKSVRELEQLSEETRTLINSLQQEILPEIDKRIAVIDSKLASMGI